MICTCCGRDIDAIGQDNCSCVPGKPLCEDCTGSKQFIDDYPEYEEEETE